ncbi:hypothetical protein TGRUB_429870 [Toxoplasma gondii RUB]|uniref:Uncharacterized protein n=1 Tax=Toxoplasma gondii RUB TaxID=935652 RepID=A0A086M4C6_TOXGO|nr:hypothetical protein TGRUB_429870 [Toxoplasma gondii RUB]
MCLPSTPTFPQKLSARFPAGPGAPANPRLLFLIRSCAFVHARSRPQRFLPLSVGPENRDQRFVGRLPLVLFFVANPASETVPCSVAAQDTPAPWVLSVCFFPAGASSTQPLQFFFSWHTSQRVRTCLLTHIVGEEAPSLSRRHSEKRCTLWQHRRTPLTAAGFIRTLQPPSFNVFCHIGGFETCERNSHCCVHIF